MLTTVRGCLRMSRPILIADFDETITAKDTTALVAQAAYRLKGSSVPPFEKYSKIYMDEYRSYLNQHPNVRRSIEEEIVFQKGLWLVERSSVDAIEQDGLFRGVPRANFTLLSPEVVLKEGFVLFANHILEQHTDFYVLSVNWSASLIRQVLSDQGITNVKILANDFHFDALDLATGVFDPKSEVRTGYDKLVCLEDIRKKLDAPIVYIGDSSGDVLPIVTADFGILIEGGRGRTQLEQLGKPPIPLLGAEIKKLTVYSASWSDLLQSWNSFNAST